MSAILLDDKKFALYGKPVENNGRTQRAKMSFQVFNGNPSIVVFTNDPADTETKPIRSGMDAFAWGGFVNVFKEVLKGENGKQYRWINRAGPPNKTFVDTIILIGKDDDGVVWLALRKEGRPVKKFEVAPSLYYDIVDAKGEPLAPGERSQLYAGGFISVLDEHMSNYIRDTYQPPQPRQPGGGYGNNNNGGGGQGGYSKPAPQQSFNDDIPM